jgi:hypothetical protein
MYYSTKKQSNLRISFLLYALITLSSTDKTFRTLDIRENVYVKPTNEILSQGFKDESPSFEYLLKKSSARLVSNDLCFFFLKNKRLDENLFLTEIEAQNKKLLRQYLKKFRHKYSCDLNIINNLRTKKEINSIALGYLMLVLGI